MAEVNLNLLNVSELGNKYHSECPRIGIMGRQFLQNAMIKTKNEGWMPLLCRDTVMILIQVIL